MDKNTRVDVLSASVAESVDSVAKAMNSYKSIEDSIPPERTDGIERQLGSADGIVLACGLRLRVVKSRAAKMESNESYEAQIFAPEGTFNYQGKNLTITNEMVDPEDKWYRVEIPDENNFELCLTISKGQKEAKVVDMKSLTMEEIVNNIAPIVLFKLGKGSDRPIGCATIVINPLVQSDSGKLTDLRHSDYSRKIEQLAVKKKGNKENVLISLSGRKAQRSRIYATVSNISKVCDTLLIFIFAHGHALGPGIGWDYIKERNRFLPDPEIPEQYFLDDEITLEDQYLFALEKTGPKEKEKEELWTCSFLAWDDGGTAGASVFPTEILLRSQAVNKRIIMVYDSCEPCLEAWLKDPVIEQLLDVRKFPPILTLVPNQNRKPSWYSRLYGSHYARALFREIEFNESYTYYDAAWDTDIKESVDSIVNANIRGLISKNPTEELDLKEMISGVPYPQMGYLPKGITQKQAFGVEFFKE